MKDMKGTKMAKSLNRIFYIYTEAPLAVLYSCFAIVEFACALAIDVPVIQSFALIAGLLMSAVAVINVSYIYKKETKGLS
jgi:hypothetical protein